MNTIAAALATACLLAMATMASGPAATSKGSTTLETTTVIVDPMALGGEVRSHSATPTLSSIVMGCGP